MILYAQRSALSEWFYELEEYNLEDTNRAFDWDHICPNSYTHNKRNIHRALKDWYNSNGNFRAWPYSLNRVDQDNSPSDKLSSSDKGQNDLLISFCNKEWLELDSDIKRTIKDNPTAKRIINCILNRNLNICLEWYDKLKINDLVPTSTKRKDIIALFESVINNTKWHWEKEDNEWRTYSLPIADNNLSLYFSFNIEEFNTLRENAIYFGLYDEDNVTISKIKTIKEQDDNILEVDRYYSYFTLTSFSGNSINNLFKEFDKWLMNLKFPTKELTIDKFHNSIKSECKQKIFTKIGIAENK